MIVTEGSTNVSVPFYFVDDVGGTNPGEPTTGLLFSDIETGGSASYQRQGAARVDFTLVTLASAAAAHTDGGFILVDDTEMPGVYRCDVPDAAFAAGADFVIIYLRAAAANNTITRPLKIDLTSVDLRDAIRGGMTALPNAVADAAGGLPISDAGGLDLDSEFAKVGTPSDFGSGTSTLAANLQDIADNGTATFDRSTDSLQAIRDRGDAAWVTGSGTGLTPLASGTAQGGTSTTIQLAAASSFADDTLIGNTVKIVSGTGAGQSRIITDHVLSTDTSTVTPAWTVTPDATSVYEIVEGAANTVLIEGLDATGQITSAISAVAIGAVATLDGTNLVNAPTLQIPRHDDYSVTITTNLNATGWAKIWITCKNMADIDNDDDSLSFFQVRLDAPSTSTLIYFNQAASPFASGVDSTLAVVTANPLVLTFTMTNEAATLLAADDDKTYQLKWEDASGNVKRVSTIGTVEIVHTVTKSTS